MEDVEAFFSDFSVFGELRQLLLGLGNEKTVVFILWGKEVRVLWHLCRGRGELGGVGSFSRMEPALIFLLDQSILFFIRNKILMNL